jgi:hypothetical protein
MRRDHQRQPRPAEEEGREHVREPMVAEVHAGGADGDREDHGHRDREHAGRPAVLAEEEQVGEDPGDRDRVQRVAARERRRRLVRRLVFDGNGSFLEYVDLRARAQSGYRASDLEEIDYVESTSPVPIFSKRFVDLIGQTLEDELVFHPCVIECEGSDYEFFAARTLLRLDLVDAARSSSRPLPDGGTSLTKLAYLDESRTDFHIARDRNEVFDLVVTDAMRSLCETHDLNMDFLPKMSPL